MTRGKCWPLPVFSRTISLYNIKNNIRNWDVKYILRINVKFFQRKKFYKLLRKMQRIRGSFKDIPVRLTSQHKNKCNNSISAYLQCNGTDHRRKFFSTKWDLPYVCKQTLPRYSNRNSTQISYELKIFPKIPLGKFKSFFLITLLLSERERSGIYLLFVFAKNKS